MANLFIPSTNCFHGRDVCFCPNSGYAVGTLLIDVVPLWNKNRTLTSSVEIGNDAAGLVVKSSKVMVEA